MSLPGFRSSVLETPRVPVSFLLLSVHHVGQNSCAVNQYLYSEKPEPLLFIYMGARLSVADH